MSFESVDVGRYYDENTRGFLAHGQGGFAGAIHRAVWGEGVASRDEAFHFVHARLRAEAAAIGAERILDLGCGTGASLERVLAGSAANGFAVTNSAVHAKLAHARLSRRATVLQQDFCGESLPARMDLAFGIESFVQAPDAKAFFANVAGCLRPSGRLVLCDDFLEGDKRDRWVREFQHGWHASSLVKPAAADAIAAVHGLELVEDCDWTSHLELDRPRDRVLGVLVTLGRPVLGGRRFRSLAGGNALRQCLKRGHVCYRYRVWEKTRS